MYLSKNVLKDGRIGIREEEKRVPLLRGEPLLLGD
jgi:hypothetical protein